MKCISIVCNKYYLYILFYWVLEIIVIIFRNYRDKYIRLSEGVPENEFISIICAVLGDLLAGILYIYTKCTLKKNKVKINEDNNSENSKHSSSYNIKLIHTNVISEKTKKALHLIPIISILYLASNSAYFLLYLIIKVKQDDSSQKLEKHQMDWHIGIDFIIRHIFSRYILKTKLYKHHIISLFICLIGFTFMTASDIMTIIDQRKSVKILFYILFIFLRVIFFSLSDVYNKVLLTDDFLLPHELMFYRGILDLFILLIITPILIFTSQLKFIFIHEGLSTRIFLKIGLVIIIFAKSFSLMKIIDKFTAQYVSFIIVAESFGDTLSSIYDYFSGDENHNVVNLIAYIIDIFSLTLILFSTLLYNEIIIINKWGISEYTKENLINNATKEMIDILNPNDNNDDLNIEGFND